MKFAETIKYDFLSVRRSRILLKRYRHRSRVMVENVVQQTKAQAVFSFDFLCLCIVASVLAAVGLAIDSPVVVVASMLVSPIMGPILAVTFGSVVHDWKLVKVGVLSELISLLICVADGFVVGLCFAPYGEFFGWSDLRLPFVTHIAH